MRNNGTTVLGPRRAAEADTATNESAQEVGGADVCSGSISSGR